ncbi:MAG TPA: molybdopterin-dependent oxidoreductase, partial [Geobacteraceae bacterium]|nr:molybdopterin-dependent oxidoreductase [Geobacteraceae bacterium]
ASATIDRIDAADAVLVIGCDLNAEATGVEYRVIRAATKGDATLVLANLRDVKLKKFANLHLKYRPGGEVHLLNGIVKAFLDGGVEDGEFVGTRTEYLDKLKKDTDSLTLDDLADGAGVAASDLRETARLLGGGKSIAVIFGADLMRSAYPRQAMEALINLALITGAMGKDAGGFFPIHEKNNIQGMLDMGAAPDTLPGRQGNTVRGKNLWEIIEAVEQGSVKALYVIASDLLSFPDNERIRKALSRLDLLIVQEIFPTETARLAHVLLPGATAAEKSGSFTTIDNRVQTFVRAIRPPGGARDDWEILSELYSRIALTRHVGSKSEILQEIGKAVDGYEGVREFGDGVGTVVCKGNIRSPGDRYEFARASLPEIPVMDGGARLLVGPILFHSGTTTTWSANNLTVAPDGYIEIFTADADRLGIADDNTIKLSAVNGCIIGKARVTNRLQAGLLFAPSHFRDLNANSLLEGSCNLVGVQVEKV